MTACALSLPVPKDYPWEVLYDATDRILQLVVGHSDEGFCFGIKDGIKRAGRNGKILVWQRIIAGFDPSRPSH
jgi:hypothetical protein